MAQKTYYSYSRSQEHGVKVGEVTRRPKPGSWTSNNPYRSFTSTSSGIPPSALFGGLAPTDPLLSNAGIPVSAVNRLYNKVVESVREGPSGELLTSALEWKSSLRMITARADLLRRAYKALRSFNLPEVARLLSLSKRQRKLVEGRIRKYSTFERPTQLWLEYWMGWAPLMGDIALALDTLTKAPPLNQRINVGVSFSDSTRTVYDNSSYGSFQVDTKGTKGTLQFYGKATIINHNLNLANTLGLANPIATAWQLVPFSFIVDWFTNVGQILSSLNAFAGVSFSGTGYGYRVDVTGSRSGWRRVATTAPPFYRTVYVSYSGTSVTKGRSPGGLPTPQLTIDLPKLSLTRAATAVSLLTEIFLIKK